MIQACEAYRTTQVTSARPEALVTMLYGGATKFMRGALDALQRGNREEAGRMLLRAQDIVVELRASLNPEAGQVSSNLDSLYDYIQDRLVTANVNKDAANVDEALRIMEGLHEAWTEATRMVVR